MVVVGELRVGDLIGPGTRVRSAEDPEVHFDLLVNMLGFAIGLGVVCGGKGEVIVKEFAKFFGKDGGELGTSVRDNFVIKSEAQVDFVEEKGSYPFSSDHFLSGAEDYPLCKAMVDHDQ